MFGQLGALSTFLLNQAGVWLWLKSTTMHVTKIEVFLWLASAVIETPIVVAMIYKKLWRDLPIFCSYLIFDIIRVCFMFLLRNNPIEYFYAYWVTEALACFAVLWVIKELFDNAFQRHLGLRQLGNVLFQWSIVILLAVGILSAWMSPGVDAKKIMAGIITVKLVVTVVESGLLAFLFLFAFTFGLGWQHYATVVCIGFGIRGTVELATVAARRIYGPYFTLIRDWIVPTLVDCSVLIWAAYFLLPKPERAIQSPIQVENRLDEWNDALLQLMKR